MVAGWPSQGTNRAATWPPEGRQGSQTPHPSRRFLTGRYLASVDALQLGFGLLHHARRIPRLDRLGNHIDDDVACCGLGGLLIRWTRVPLGASVFRHGREGGEGWIAGIHLM